MYVVATTLLLRAPYYCSKLQCCALHRVLQCFSVRTQSYSCSHTSKYFTHVQKTHIIIFKNSFEIWVSVSMSNAAIVYYTHDSLQNIQYTIYLILFSLSNALKKGVFVDAVTSNHIWYCCCCFFVFICDIFCVFVSLTYRKNSC